MLIATVLGSGMALLDSTVVGIALPKIGEDFHVGVASLQWVSAAYTLTLASFLLLGGTLGDRLGRRKIFTAGVVWFAVASALCTVAPDAPALIGARALQGVGGALLTPGSLAILQASFAPGDRSRAIGAWSGLGGIATAAGPLVGGYLLAVASWRWVFLINLPISVAVVMVTRRHVPESVDESAGGIDGAGASLLVVALAGLSFALIEGPGLGWTSWQIVSCLVAAVVAGLAFGLVERRTKHPMMPPGLFGARQFAATNAATFLLYGALSGALFLLPVTLEQVAGYSPLEAGLSLLPVTALMLLFSARSGRLATVIGPRLQMTVGPLVVGAGMVLLTRVVSDHNYLTGVLPGAVLLGIGLTTTVAPLTSTAMSSAPSEHAGVASAVNNDVARAGGLVAVALIPVVSGLTGNSYLHPAVFGHGFHTAGWVTAGLCLGAALIAGLAIRNDAAKLD